jgi:hypothetical protein
MYDSNLVLNAELWKHDGSAFMSDDAYGHICTVTEVAWTPLGRTFDGTNDEISLGSPSALRILKDKTLEAWVNTSLVDASRRWIVGWVGGSLQTRRYNLHVINTGGGTIGMNIANGTADWVLTTYAVGASLLNRWVHIAGTYINGNHKLYLNGVYVATGSTNEDCDTSTNNIKIGTGDDATYFAGTIGEVRIYNRALTPSEVQSNYLLTKSRYQ